MTTMLISFEIPSLSVTETPAGNYVVQCVGEHRSFFGVIHPFVGDTVVFDFVRDVEGVRFGSGWTLELDGGEIADRLARLLFWVATGVRV